MSIVETQTIETFLKNSFRIYNNRIFYFEPPVMRLMYSDEYEIRYVTRDGSNLFTYEIYSGHVMTSPETFNEIVRPKYLTKLLRILYGT